MGAALKLYGKRILKTGVERKLALRSETQDAILWSVQSSSRICSVKVQGSNTLIQAYYPENWEKTPAWLKPGNAVKIMHTGGNRGRIEIVGHGLMVPTPVTGSEAPTVATAPDAVLTGCQLYPAPNDPQMVVLVGIGTYRIGGVTCTLDAIACDSDVYDANMGGVIGTIAGAFSVPAAPAAQLCRYDAIEVGADGVLHYLAGTPSATPTDPAITADHVQVGMRIMVPAGTAAIGGANIGGSYTAAKAAQLTAVASPDHLHPADTTSTITVTVFDQYGNAISGFYVITAEFSNDDDGTISGDGAAAATASRTGTFSSTTFTYTKGTTHAGIIQFTLHMNIAITAAVAVSCYDT